MKIFFKGLRYLLLVLTGLVIIIEGLWLIALPEDLIKEKIITSLPHGLDIELEGLRKKVLPGLYIKRAILKIYDTELELKEINSSINITSLLGGRFGINININNGLINGLINSRGKGFLKGEGFRLSEVKNPYIKGDCILFFVAQLKEERGIIDFSCNEARLEPLKYDTFYLPLNLIEKIQGRIGIDRDKVIIESINLSGKDIYGRIQGRIEKKLADLTIELMPEPSLHNALMLLMPGRMVSPGYFKIEIKRQL